jgi:hypothetical protein
MPPLTRWHIKSALVYFVAALLAGLGLALRSVMELPSIVGALAPVYFHLLMVGWVTQLIFGVAYWMFPRFSAEEPRGNEPLGWATCWLLNIGLVLRVIGEPLMTLQPNVIFGWVVVFSAALQWLAGLGFVVNMWGRVKEK